MNLVLNIYTDDSLTDIKRVVEADRLKIPYRVSVFLIQSLDSVELNSDEDLIKFISNNVDKMDKIIKATFCITDTELECVDSGELIQVLKELYSWGMGKINSINRGSSSKN